MRCAQCGKLSFRLICDDCARNLSEFEAGTRELADGFKIYYFYKYSSIKKLIFSKHHMHGGFVFQALAKISFAAWAREQDFGGEYVLAVPLDDHVRGGYSHTAILARALRSNVIKPIFGALRAKNHVKYAGKTLKFRQTHPRGFALSKPLSAPVILVDDVVTTGTSMLEAKKAVEKAGGSVLFGLVLADAKEDL